MITVSDTGLSFKDPVRTILSTRCLITSPLVRISENEDAGISLITYLTSCLRSSMILREGYPGIDWRRIYRGALEVRDNKPSCITSLDVKYAIEILYTLLSIFTLKFNLDMKLLVPENLVNEVKIISDNEILKYLSAMSGEFQLLWEEESM